MSNFEFITSESKYPQHVVRNAAFRMLMNASYFHSGETCELLRDLAWKVAP